MGFFGKLIRSFFAALFLVGGTAIVIGGAILYFKVKNDTTRLITACETDFLTKKEANQFNADAQELEKQGDKLFGQNDYKLAAQKYAETVTQVLIDNDSDLQQISREVAINLRLSAGIEGNGILARSIRKEAIMSRLLKEKPDFLQKLAELQFKRGQAYARFNENNQATDCFSAALELKIIPPNDASAYLNRAEAYRAAGLNGSAHADYLKASELFKQYKLPKYAQIADEKLKLLPPTTDN